MKKYFILYLTAFFLLSSIHSDAVSDSLQKEHGRIISKANTFFSSTKAEIESRIKKTERFASSCSKDTVGAKSLIKVYRADSMFYQTVVQKGDSLLEILLAHEKLVAETMQKGDLSDKFSFENEEKIDKVKWIISYVKDILRQIEKKLKVANKELKEMQCAHLKKKK